jgi:hypothetical protein
LGANCLGVCGPFSNLALAALAALMAIAVFAGRAGEKTESPPPAVVVVADTHDLSGNRLKEATQQCSFGVMR